MAQFAVSASGSSDDSDGAAPSAHAHVGAKDVLMSGGKESILIDDIAPKDFSIQDAIHQKEMGNKCMGEKDLPGAEVAYGKGLDIVTLLRDHAMSVDGGGAVDASAHNLNQTEAVLRSNLSLVLNKLERYDEAERHCSIALELEPNQWKVHYRRAKARENLETPGPDLVGAEADLVACIDILTMESADGKNSIKAKALPSTLADARSSLERVRMSIEEKGQRVLQDVPMAIGQPSAANETSSSEGPSFCASPSPKEQRTAILRLLAAYENNFGDAAKLRPREALIGEAFMLIDMQWWKSWCRHVDFFRDAEMKEAIRAESDPTSATEMIRQRAKSAKTSALRGRLAATQLLPPGAYLSPMPSIKDVEKENDVKEKRRSSAASSSSSSSEESSEDDEWLDIEGAFGPLPRSIDNSLLILKTDGNAGTKDAHDEFFTEWCRPSEDSSGDDETEDGSHFVRLRPNLVRGHHFECLPREAYGALVCWYGDETPPICRRATASHNDSGGDMVRILLYPELQHNNTGGLSPTWLGNDVGERSALAAISLPFLCGACKSPGATAQCTRCLSIRYCRKECQVSHWTYHKATCKAISASRKDSLEKTSPTSKVKAIDDDPSEWGRIGLNNLGNTCFMNSALQALSHSAPLTKFFLSGRFKGDVNEDNPLGSGGKLAYAYEEVIKELWMNNARSVSSTSPTSMKRAIALHAPQFAGSSQHDSHEYITYLLDALHEDLNRVKNAPYVEFPDALPGQKLAIAGAEAWDLYRRRNDSLVMDSFFGQFKSTCVCPKCKKVSVSYDAFKDVSIEIPQLRVTHRVVDVYLFPVATQSDKAPMTKYGLHVNVNETIEGLKMTLSELCGIPTEKLVFCSVGNARLAGIYENESQISDIEHGKPVFAYESFPISSKTHIHAPVTQVADSDGSLQMGGIPVGWPFLSSFSLDVTCKQVWEHVWLQARRFVVEGDDSTVDDRKGLFRIMLVDAQGRPKPVFRETDGSSGDASSFLPRSDIPLVDILGESARSDYVYFNTVWTDINEQYLNFDTCVDHASVATTYKKQQEMMSRQISLQKCFENFTMPERLDDDNMYYCSTCKEHVRATKTMELWRLPNVLVVHLKRFEFRNAIRSFKDETFVDFPIEGLDMSPYCAHPNATVPSSATGASSHDGHGGSGGAKAGSNTDFTVDSIPAIYDLFGVVNHYGRLGFGHYTAFARRWDENGIDKDWALFDDSSVRSVGEQGPHTSGHDAIVGPAAYVLFYRRRVFT